ncbi:red chlorophyll catabolite reductase isoform X2 [Salvia miltiorrhiza]|uniref:red chlorophyll catabolite reductase isoform X2 n=1 Tax=Salvia miltiorrhiza TaxID=226208 RepID=UPI0025AD8098|nr:red chlorophyll catabolite reductase isoform X2 [Salvia miltiorrhiza]XP_057811326.1 red chlorophyll catabolite reductase isoform X2 [Salvia miltiorrhiza]XP_057811331.1 red chlorophyll catabolite reductase isoform X2 [Salvia miltiorrhiza]XP_057811335.1 red chlorophyll catabolite reductase isoform X2 [Salvia miltiorrhiza]XP_057811340.1 red chlorophyll catabolite reductase isoform X2 [Salvia miltiorrhiza]XP_057811345.1 red chlorophyll catabolite reductase isoform X2 [Salvia miltiorrhiza]
MAASCIVHFPLITTPRSQFSASRGQFRCSSAANSNAMDSGKVKFMEFPYASAPTKKLMVELFSSVEEQLGSSLHPSCTLAPDVQYFGNPTDTAHASLHIRSGLPSSQIDFVLGSWIHCQLPSGGALNITSLSAYLTPSTDAPHFLLELIQSSPTSLVLILDLTPRKDLILYPDYLNRYYEDTQLDRHRQRLQMLPEVRPYISPSLYIRAVVSPTAIVVTIDTGATESKTIEQIIEDDVSPIAKDLLRFWIESCACCGRDVDASERAYLAQRDRIIKKTTIDVDLSSSFPRLFGQEIADRAVNALKEYYFK